MTVIALILGQLPSSALPVRADIRRRSLAAGTAALVLVIVAVIVSSHPLTPLMLISALVVLSLPRRNRRVVLPVLAGALCSRPPGTPPWHGRTSPHTSQHHGRPLQPDANIASGPGHLGPAAPGHVLVSWVDRGLSGAVFLLAAIAFVRRPWTRRTGLPLLVLAPLPVLRRERRTAGR